MMQERQSECCEAAWWSLFCGTLMGVGTAYNWVELSESCVQNVTWLGILESGLLLIASFGFLLSGITLLIVRRIYYARRILAVIRALAAVWLVAVLAKGIVIMTGLVHGHIDLCGTIITLMFFLYFRKVYSRSTSSVKEGSEKGSEAIDGER